MEGEDGSAWVKEGQLHGMERFAVARDRQPQCQGSALEEAGPSAVFQKDEAVRGGYRVCRHGRERARAAGTWPSLNPTSQSHRSRSQQPSRSFLRAHLVHVSDKSLLLPS